MKVTVFGATGDTGRLIVDRALEEGHEVTAVARRPESLTRKHGQLRVVQGDVLDRASVEAAVEGRDAVISALGTRSLKPTTLYSAGTAKIVRAMEKEGLRRLVLISSGGVDKEDPGLPFWYTRILDPLLFKNLYADMRIMEGEVRGSGLDWTMVRASYLTDGVRRGDYRVEDTQHPKGGWRISRADLAEFVVGQLEDDRYVGKAPRIAY